MYIHISVLIKTIYKPNSTPSIDRLVLFIIDKVNKHVATYLGPSSGLTCSTKIKVKQFSTLIKLVGNRLVDLTAFYRKNAYKCSLS